METQVQDSRTLTFGEKLVGLNFNPAGDTKVERVKRLCAELADILQEEYFYQEATSELRNQLYNHAVGEILNAQMNVVKVITLKY
jgi:hypothetical protein